ncbi:hypothetical protein ABEB36_001779 [Hypothenemus hampei]|uniref:FAM234A/B beta-propeller domain-containing protein n=1 Tax=Hypothenemus hampei TaxID=57062 RepID=A0ABD1FFP9_HYPHA
MKMAHSMQGIYAPLPQSLSDSDSDKEISMEPICTSYNSKGMETFDPSYKQNGHSLVLDDEEVKIRGARKMSMTRMVAFVTSIVLCFLPIFIFLWVLPCSELHTCPVKINDWEREQKGIELKGPINLVAGAYKTSLNLAIMYKGGFNSRKNLRHGIVSYMGPTGKVAWDFEQDVEPLGMDCGVVDVNGDGNLECLVVDLKGLKAIETVSGQALWHAHSSEEKNVIRNLELPVAVKDFNGDNIKELISIYENKKLLMISGQNGKVLADFPIRHCNEISNLISREDSEITFNCFNSNGSYQSNTISVIELEKTWKNPQYHMIIQPVDDDHNDKGVFKLGNRKLSLKNGPNCPKCHPSLTLYDQNDQVLKNWSYNNAFITNPKAFSFEKGLKEKLQGHLNGFVMKIWKWSEQYKKLRPAERINRREMTSHMRNETFFSTDVTESVVLITFNDTNTNEINASYTHITQICRNSENDCQPSVDSHKDSLLVEDLENDSSKELVSYYSSYLRNNNDWDLKSFVKALRLEDELPKLYGNK